MRTEKTKRFSSVLKTSVAVSIFALGCSAAPWSTAFAEGAPGEGCHGMRGSFAFRGLDLTADQKTQLQAIASAHDATLKTDREAAKTARKNLGAYLKGGGADAAQINTLVSAVTSSMNAMLTEQIAKFTAGYAILTDQQKQTLSQKKGPLFMGRRHHHGWGSKDDSEAKS